MITPEIIAATRNRAKLAEFQRLTGPDWRIVPAPDRQELIAEDEITFEANAATKALALSREPGIDTLVVASDGGMLVPALGTNWNPLTTRRFAGPQATDLDRIRQLLQRAQHLQDDERTISWCEAVALAHRGTLIGVWSAESEPGMLATTFNAALLDLNPGFWMPVIWLVPRFGYRPLAVLTDTERARIEDHWYRLQAPVRRALREFGIAGETRQTSG